MLYFQTILAIMKSFHLLKYWLITMYRVGRVKSVLNKTDMVLVFGELFFLEGKMQPWANIQEKVWPVVIATRELKRGIYFKLRRWAIHSKELKPIWWETASNRKIKYDPPDTGERKENLSAKILKSERGGEL